MDERRPSYWETGMPPPAPPPGELPRRVDVLIVGAGFMGRWLAYFLGRMKTPPRTLVIERDRFTYGASSRNAGFLTCGQVSEMLADASDHGDHAVVETFLLRRRGIQIVRREFPDLPVDACGSTDYDEVTDAGRALAAKFNDAAGEEIYVVRPSRLGGRVRPAFFNRADGGVQPVSLLRLLRDRTPGTRFVFNTTAKRVAGGNAVLDTPHGEQSVEYGRAFLCVNGFAANLDASSNVVPGRGQVIVTSPVSAETERTLGYMNRGYDYFRFVDGRLLLGGGRDRFASERGADELQPTGDVLDHLKGRAKEILGHGEFRVDHHWAGVMGFVGGGHLGGSPRRKLDDKTEMIAGFGGMGVALSPVYAEQAAAEMS